MRALAQVTDSWGSWFQMIQSVVPLLTLLMTVFLAWYVNYSLKKRLYFQELTEKRLKELYRPMDITLRAGKLAFKRYMRAGPEEQKHIAKLWNKYNRYMKKLIIRNSYLFVEPELPPEVNKLIEHIDSYLFDYDQYVQGKKEHPFPGERGYPFPSDINEYFSTRSRQLVESLGAKRRK